MRFDINLATNPYEDARRFFQRAGSALVLVLLVTAALAFLIFHESSSTRRIDAQISSVQTAIKGLDEQEQQARDVLARPENQGTRQQSQFMNSLLLQRAFSWTELFAQLERLMPNGVRVLSISPKLTDADQIALKITVGGDSREHALDLLHNLETTKSFRDPQITSEVAEQQHTADSDPEKFDFTVFYVPSEADGTADVQPPLPNAAGSGARLEARR